MCPGHTGHTGHKGHTRVSRLTVWVVSKAGGENGACSRDHRIFRNASRVPPRPAASSHPPPPRGTEPGACHHPALLGDTGYGPAPTHLCHGTADVGNAAARCHLPASAHFRHYGCVVAFASHAASGRISLEPRKASRGSTELTRSPSALLRPPALPPAAGGPRASPSSPPPARPPPAPRSLHTPPPLRYSIRTSFQ